MELKIEARNLDMRKNWQDKIEDEKAKLIRHYADLVLHLRVTIESTSSHKEGGFEIIIVATIPNDTIVVKRHGELVYSILVEGFDVLGLRLKELVKKKQHRKNGKLKGSLGGADGATGYVGTIKRLFPYESYGFIGTSDDQEIFFHENSLKDITMAQLKVDDQVIFNAVETDKGLQANSVKIDKV